MSTYTSVPGIDAAREHFGLTLEEIASSLRADYATLYRWREGTSPSPVFQDRLQRLQELVDAVVSQVGPENTMEWIVTPMAVFGGRTPREMILSGRGETLLGALLSNQFLRNALEQRAGPGGEEAPLRHRALTALWEAEADALFERMQRPGFLDEALEALQAPLTARLSDVTPRSRR